MSKMTRDQASAEAVRRWGKTGSIRDRGSKFRSSPESRKAASDELKALREMKPESPDVRDTVKWPDDLTLREFRRALVEARDAYVGWKARHDELFSAALNKRFQVGSITSGLFFVRGSGDSWEDAFLNADKGGD